MAKNNTQNTSDIVQEELKSAYDSLLSKRNRSFLLRSILILFAGFTAFIIAENVIYLSLVTKSVLVSAILLAAGMAYWKGFKNRSSEKFTQFYREFSRKSNLPELKDTLDLEKSGSGNPALVNAAILQNLSKIESSRLNESLSDYVSTSKTYKSFKQLASLGIIFLIVFGITSLNFNDATQRAFSFWKTYEKPNPYSFNITPGNITLEQGNPFKVDIEFKNSSIPNDIELRIKTSVETEFRSRAMEGSGNVISSIPQDLNNDLQYYVEMDGYKSDIYTADVQLRPRFSNLQATVIPPEYTNLDSTITSYPISQIRPYQGSKLILSGESNKEISFLQLYTHKELLDLFIENDSTFTYDLEIKDPDTLRFYIEDENGITNQNPFQIILSPQVDEFPLAEIIEPQENLREVNPKEINLLYRGSDDFGLTAASLNYELRRAYVEEPISGSISLKRPTLESIQSFVWDLSKLNLKPQDLLTFWITVQDNDGYNGYKSSDSQMMTLEVPSLVEYFDDVDEKENDVEKDLSEISEAFEQTSEQYERFKERMKDNPENAGYEEKRELEQVQKQQEDVENKINELNEKFEELKNELSSDNMLSEETQKAYDELQKLMEEIDDPAYREALEKLQEQLGQMSPEEMRKAMEDLEFNEELYKERLERTIELFKQLKLNSDLDKLANSFEDMARKEDENSQSETSDDEKLQNALDENESLQEKIESLSENTTKKNEREIAEFQEESKKKLKELSKEISEQMDSSNESGDQGEEGEEDSESDSDSSNGDQNDSQSRQERYQELAETTRNLMKGMSNSQMQINVAGLQYVLYSLLTLSLEQEDLTSLASNAENRSQAFINYARTQRNVESIFDAVSDSLFQLSTEIPQFSNKINEKKLEVKNRLSRSLEQMSERDRNQSSIASRQALGGINEISFMVADLLENLQNSGGEGGGGSGMSMQQMMEQLQQSGQDQQQLNQMMQEMINDMQGERLSRDQMERLNQIAKQQNAIRKQLQQLQKSGELDGDRMGSELERMIEDMEDTINDLRGGAANSTLIERQQNILSRMLEAEQAMQERGEEETREGRDPENTNRSIPPDITLEELEKTIQNRLNDPNFTKYSPDYQRLIENYFELLKELREREIQ